MLYPNGGFNVGVDFAFPQGAVAYFPPGATINIAAPIGAVLPGGRDINNTSLQAVKVVLHHGGMLGVGNARAVLQDGFASGTGQELFDIELRAEAGVFGRACFTHNHYDCCALLAGQRYFATLYRTCHRQCRAGDVGRGYAIEK